MKSFKIILPLALTFAMFLGSNVLQGQGLSATNNSGEQNIEVTLPEYAKRTIGLDYKSTLAQIHNTLATKIKSNRAIDFKGMVVINLTLDAVGKVNNIEFNKALPQSLASNIIKALEDETYKPVTLNGKTKAQSFSIPLVVK